VKKQPAHTLYIKSDSSDVEMKSPKVKASSSTRRRIKEVREEDTVETGMSL
jgi:hypothetical protein